MRRINQTRSEGINGDDWERLLADVRGHIWAAGHFQVTADKAGLSRDTVAALAYGDTKSPHLRTVMKIMTALGKAHPILDAFRATEPVWIKDATTRKQHRKVRDRMKQERTDKIFPHRSKRRQAAAGALH